MSTKSRRGGFKALFVEPYVQVRLGLMFICLNIVFSFLILSVFSYYVYDMYMAIKTHFALDSAGGLVTLSKFSTPIVFGGILIVVFIVITLLVSAHYTHKIYGPLIAINRFLDDMLHKKPLNKIQLRESDQLKELADKLNKIAKQQGLLKD